MNRALRAWTNTVGVGLALALMACASNQFGAPCPIPDKATREQRDAALRACFGVVGTENFQSTPRRDLDILFVIDNSTSMAPKQRALAKNIPKFIQRIDGFKTNYHVGVATSDVGSTTAEGLSWTDPTGSIGQCNRFKGDDGLLQVIPCSQRTNGTPESQMACAALCNSPMFTGRSSVTTDGTRFISRTAGVTNVPPLIQGGVDMGAIQAFQCMALVGDGGCGIEGQLEGVRRALDGHLAENAGFLRKNSILAVILITDEDDCSVQLARRSENNPLTRDCSNPDQNASYDCYNFDYRCLARSIQCDQPLNSQGQKTNCRERPNNYLESVKTYHDFLLSLVRNPQDLVVSGIWTLPSLDKGGQLVTTYQGGAGNSSSALNRGPNTLASCRYTGSDPDFTGVFGNAQWRLSAFANSFGVDDKGMPNGIELSLCDIDHYEDALKKIADILSLKLQNNCLPVVPKFSNGQPVCLVGDVDTNNAEGFPDKLFPTCSATCCQAFASAAEPNVEDAGVISACSAESADCYCAVKSTQPGVCTGAGKVGWVGNVWRKGGAAPPAGVELSFRCAGQ